MPNNQDYKSPPDPREEVWVGARLKDRYEIVELIGEGASGYVYKALDHGLSDRPVAVKLLDVTRLSPDPRDYLLIRNQFHDQMEALARIDHQNVIKVFDYGETAGGNLYLVTEYVKGPTLRRVMKPETGMGFAYAARLIRQLGQALAASHEKHVLHCDLKPENIMLKEASRGEDVVKLIDFGVAKVFQSQTANSMMSRDFSGKGTWPYMSPEQLMNRKLDHRSDIYALGVIAFEMITGSRPFRVANAAVLASAQRGGMRLDPAQLRPDLPEAARPALLKALELEPRQRYSDVRVFGDELAEALAGHEPESGWARAGDKKYDTTHISAPRDPATRPSPPPGGPPPGAKRVMQKGLEFAHVLHVDPIVPPEMPIDDFVALWNELLDVAHHTASYQEAHEARELVFQQHGKGMAFVFSRIPEAPAECALEIAHALRHHSGIACRMGMNSGMLSINKQTNQVHGDALELAERVAGCGDAGHILVSEEMRKPLSQIGRWAKSLADLGAHQVGSARLRLYNFCHDGLGNTATPISLRSTADLDEQGQQPGEAKAPPEAAPRRTVKIKPEEQDPHSDRQTGSQAEGRGQPSDRQPGSQAEDQGRPSDRQTGSQAEDPGQQSDRQPGSGTGSRTGRAGDGGRQRSRADDNQQRGGGESRPRIPVATLSAHLNQADLRQQAAGRQGDELIYTLGHGVPESKTIDQPLLQRQLDGIRHQVDKLLTCALMARPRDNQLDEEAYALALHVLPEEGFADLMGPRAQPQFDCLWDIASNIPWELLEERYYVCPRGHKLFLWEWEERIKRHFKRHQDQPVAAGIVRCDIDHEEMRLAVSKLALDYYLTHLIRGGSPTGGLGGLAAGEGRRFLLIIDPTEELCRENPPLDPKGIGLKHANYALGTLPPLLRQCGYDDHVLAGSQATVEAVLDLIGPRQKKEEEVAGIYYFGHGRASQPGSASCLVLHNGELTARDIKRAEPTAKFIFLNACEGGAPARHWHPNQGPQHVAHAFVQGSPDKVVIASFWPLFSLQAAKAAERFCRLALKGASFGEALQRVRRHSYRLYQANQPHQVWFSYHYSGDPNFALPVLAQHQSEPSLMLFDEGGRLNEKLFTFGLDEVRFRAAKRRNLQGRAQVTVADFLAGLIRKGDLTRFLLRRSGVNPDDLYRQICDQVEAEAEPASRENPYGARQH